MGTLKWYFSNGTQKVGPFDESESSNFLTEQSGFFQAHTLVYRQTWPEWRKCESLEELKQFLSLTSKKELEERLQKEKKSLNQETLIKSIAYSFLLGAAIGAVVLFLFLPKPEQFVPPSLQAPPPAKCSP